MPVNSTDREILKRQNKLSNLLSPLLKNSRIAANKANSEKGVYIIAAYSGSLPSNNLPYKNWYFKTHLDNVRGNYFEIWNFISKDQWQLQWSSLGLYYKERELLALHCEPNCLKNHRSYKYKAGPHIHVIHQNSKTLSDAHVPLNLSNLDLVINSIEELDKAYKEAIQMINNEIMLASLPMDFAVGV